MYNFGKCADTLVISNDSGDVNWWQFGNGGYDWLVEGPSSDNGDILMQFTGLRDKNGVELYEGDVVKFDDSNKNYLIEYAEGRFYGSRQSDEIVKGELGKTDWLRWNQKGINGDAEVIMERLPNFEILGNKYENPELLIDGQG